MTDPLFTVEPLGKHHLPLRKAFSCGEEDLDRYLKEKANKHHATVTIVWILYDTQAEAIAGYYTLSNASVALNGLPPDLARGLPSYPVPVTLLGMMAVDRTYQKQGLGEELILDALHRTLIASRAIGSFAMMVDARYEASRPFYFKYGFLPFPKDELRLVLPMTTIEALFKDQHL